MRVAELMTKDVACVRKSEMCATAVRLMWDCDCGSVPVLDEDGNQVVGIVTDRDICMATWSKDLSPSAIRVSDAMSKELHCCSPGDGVALAENLMRARQIRRLPVLDDDRRLVGILSLADIVRAAGRSGGRTAGSEVSPMEITSTLANICQPTPANSVAPAF